MSQHNEDHSHEAIAKRLKQKPSINYLREWVYGGIDGGVTTFAVVAGVAGADLPATIILIIAIAGLLGDGFSMAAGCYSSTKTEEDNYRNLHQYEARSVKQDPEGERKEIRQIFANKGFAGENLDNIVETITANKKIWIETMMIEEYGLTGHHHKAFPAAFNTFAAFLICGAMPVLPFILGFSRGLTFSIIFSGITFFCIGALKSLWSEKPWWWHGLETFAIGSVAACVAFGAGYGLKLLLL